MRPLEFIARIWERVVFYIAVVTVPLFCISLALGTLAWAIYGIRSIFHG